MKSVITFVKSNPGSILFFLLAILGVLTVSDYGISWDEDIQRQTGLINYNYIFNGDSSLLTWKDRDYGVAFELPLIFAEKVFGLTDYHSIFVLRHLITHLFFLISGFVLYKLILLLFKNKVLGVIGFLMLVSHPVIYGHSFFNSKDLPFLSMLIIVLYLVVLAIKKSKWLNFLYLGIATGLLIDIRLMGVIVPPAIGAYLFVQSLLDKKWRERTIHFGVFILTLVCTVVLFWPFLWESPIENFTFAFKNMSQFRWDDDVLFNGQLIPATEIPWYYAPVWFAISTPLFFLLLGVAGIFWSVFKFVKSPICALKDKELSITLLMFVFFVGPLLMVIILHSVLYDSWRQLFFIYPAFVLAAIYGIQEMKGRLRKIGVGATLISVVFLLIFQVKQFPLQYVYFNQLVQDKTNRPLRSQWETDYWCLGFTSGLNTILEKDENDHIRIAFSHYPGKYAVNFLPANERNRVEMVTSLKEADYFVVVYRWHPEEYQNDQLEIFQEFKFDETSFCKVFKVNK